MTQPTIKDGAIADDITAGNIGGFIIGTAADNILQLNGSAQIPAVDGSLLTNVDADLLGGQPVGTGPLDIVALDASSRLPAVDGSQLTNLPASGPIVHAGRITGAGTVHAGTDAWTVSNVNAGRYTLTHGLGHTNYSIITGMANVASITGPRTTMTDIKLTNTVDIYINDAATGAQLNDDVEYTLIEW